MSTDKTIPVAVAQPVVGVQVQSAPAQMEMERQLPAVGSAEWDNGLFGCCSHKDCGPGCCCNFYCCSMCVWANAVSLSGMEPFGIASPDTLCWATIGIHCCTSYCCGPCLWSYEMRQQLTKNLGIDETPMCSAAQAVCCTGCSIMQMTHEIMTRKNLKFGCCGSVEVDQNAPTAGVDVVVNVKS